VTGDGEFVLSMHLGIRKGFPPWSAWLTGSSVQSMSPFVSLTRDEK
jgi:hypothetical protein